MFSFMSVSFLGSVHDMIFLYEIKYKRKDNHNKIDTTRFARKSLYYQAHKQSAHVDGVRVI